jgi:hypothetical protein
MHAPISEGLVTLNAEGKRYTASFQIEGGAITVTSGSVSTTVELRDTISPQSIARTILRAMVREGRAADWASGGGEKSRGTAKTVPDTQHPPWRTHCVIGKA